MRLCSVCTETYRGGEIRMVKIRGKQANHGTTMKIISLITLGHGKWVSNVCENSNGDLHKLYHDFTIFTTTYAVNIV